MSKLTQFDTSGQAHMVNVGDKAETKRIAIAGGSIRMQADTLVTIEAGDAKKGDVLGIARIAAILGSKRTAELIPLCHPIPLTKIGVEFQVDRPALTVHCQVTAETVGRTGVEMEALTAASVALLTIYDMCKAMDRGMIISDIRLLEKRGGKSGHWQTSDNA